MKKNKFLKKYFFLFSEDNEIEISRWKNDDDVFVETHNFSLMLQKVEKNKYVTFVGVPGSGKTALCRHIALRLQNEGYDILPIRDYNKLKDYCDPKRPQVFVIDDVIGVLGVDMDAFKLLKRYEDKVKKPTMEDTKVLMTCRKIVFKNETILHSFLANAENVVELHNKENTLNEEDKFKILEKYQINKNMFTSADLASSSNMFPYLCKQFSTKKYKEYGPTFFISPIPCILNELKSMQISNRIHYASLVLLMAHRKKLSEEILENKESNISGNKNQMKCHLLKKCKVDSGTNSFEFTDALSEMGGTYTQICGSEFTFIHDSMFEIVAFHFGEQFPEFILQYMSSDYIAHYIKLDKYKTRKRKIETEDQVKQTKTESEHSEKTAEQGNVIDLRIMLKESQYHFFAERLLKNVENGEFYNVFENEALKHPIFLRTFLDVMKSKHYTDLYSLFLSEVTESSKLQRCKNYFVDKHRLLIYSMFRNSSVELPYVRAINWVICYGHNQILQVLVDQMLKCTGKIDDLFQSPFKRSHGFHLETGRGATIDNIGTEGCVKMFKPNENQQTSVESYTKTVTEEQRRLLRLSFLSNDINTVQILLKFVHKNVLNTAMKGRFDSYFYKRPLTFACESGNLNIVVELLNAGSLVYVEEEDDSPLLAAIRNGHSVDIKVVDILINRGADVNLSNGRNSPLETAISKHNLKLVNFLIDRKADVNLENKEVSPCGTRLSTPLAVACKERQLEIVTELLMRGADINKKVRLDNKWQSPLQIACSWRFFDLAMLLLNKGADIKFDNEKELVIACRYGWKEDVFDLIEAGADVNAKEIADLFDDIINNKNERKKFDKIWMSRPLIEACCYGHIDVIDKLLESGAVVNSHNKYSSGKTPLIAACYRGNMNVVEQLIKNGADVNLQSRIDFPLSAASKMRHYHLVLALLKAEGNMLSSTIGDAMGIALSHGDNHIAEEILKVTDIAYEATGHFSALGSAFSSGKLNFIRTINRIGTANCLYKKSCSPFIIACENGNLSEVLKLLKAGADVNKKDDFETPLTTACRRGQTNVIKTLLENSAAVNLNDDLGTPLTVACRHGHLSAVQILIKAGAGVNMFRFYDTPLSAACTNGQIRLIETLLEAGADINQSDYCNTPLTAAIECGDCNLVEHLIKKGANINLPSKNTTPLAKASAFGYLTIVKKLLEAGTEEMQDNSKHLPLWYACANGNESVVKELINAGVDVNKGTENSTSLTVACEKGHLSVVNVLIKAGANVNDKKGRDSPLTVACRKGYLNIVKELIKSKADVNLTDKYDSPLVVACSKGHLSVVQELLNAGANVNVKTYFGTPLTVACKTGHAEVVFELINAMADVHLMIKGNTSLTLACKNGHLNVVVELIKARADVNQNDKSQTPLIAACKNRCKSIVRELLRAGADVDMKFKNATPLLTACEVGSTGLVAELIKAGANVNLNVGNCTPLTVAFDNEHMGVCKELMKAGADVNVMYIVRFPDFYNRTRRFLRYNFCI